MSDQSDKLPKSPENMQVSSKMLDARRRWFELYSSRLAEAALAPQQEGVTYTCPCCGYPTLSERGGYEICPLCECEDDGQDDPRAAEIWGGPNGDYSLMEARTSFALHLTMYRPTDVRYKQSVAELVR